MSADQSLATPPDIANQLSPELQDMIGNTQNGSLGFHFYDGLGEQVLTGAGEALVEMNS